MRCVSADGRPSVIGLVYRLTIPSDCVLHALKEAPTRSRFSGRSGDPGLNPFGKSNSTGFAQQHRYRKDFIGANCDCG
jgi:hypothetical protein